jgi:hypothetical protein
MGSGTNFTAPLGTPDYFGVSVTPGSQQQTPIVDPAPGGASLTLNQPGGDASTILGNAITNNNTTPLWGGQPVISAPAVAGVVNTVGTTGQAVGGLWTGIQNAVSGSAPTWGQIFGNAGIIILGVVLITVALAGNRSTVVNITKSALK